MRHEQEPGVGGTLPARPRRVRLQAKLPDPALEERYERPCWGSAGEPSVHPRSDRGWSAPLDPGTGASPESIRVSAGFAGGPAVKTWVGLSRRDGTRGRGPAWMIELIERGGELSMILRILDHVGPPIRAASRGAVRLSPTQSSSLTVSSRRAGSPPRSLFGWRRSAAILPTTTISHRAVRGERARTGMSLSRRTGPDHSRAPQPRGKRSPA